MKKNSIPQTDMIFMAVAFVLMLAAIAVFWFMMRPQIDPPTSPPSFTVSTPAQLPTGTVVMASALPGGGSGSAGGGGAAAGGGGAMGGARVGGMAGPAKGGGMAGPAKGGASSKGPGMGMPGGAGGGDR